MNDLFGDTSLSAALGLVALALIPLALVTLTSFAKIAVVLSALRNALGAPDVPSGAIITAVALALSVYVMAPVASQIAARATAKPPAALASWLDAAREPARAFLARNAGAEEQQLFLDLSRERGHEATADDLSLLWASFTLSELKQAFIVGFFVYLPFLVLDLVVAHILLALGLHGLAPQVVALPFKLLLFVSVDGFALISKALVLSYK